MRIWNVDLGRMPLSRRLCVKADSAIEAATEAMKIFDNDPAIDLDYIDVGPLCTVLNP